MKTTKTGTGLTHSVVVHGLCLPLADRLVRRYHGEAGGYLLFPHNGARRVSEQESRIVLCHLLESAGRYYSLEPPSTMADYMQSGLRGTRARADVTIHSRGGIASAKVGLEMPRVLNIALKANLPATPTFRKDLEKLAREGIPGLWFHILDDNNGDTLPSLAARMGQAWKQLAKAGVTPSHEITFAVCVLRKRELYTGAIAVAEGDLRDQREVCEVWSQGIDALFDGSYSAWQAHRLEHRSTAQQSR